MAYSSTQALNFQPAIETPRKRLRIAIAGGTRAPERARSWIESAASWLPSELESTLLLLVCELVNNAVRHGGGGEDSHGRDPLLEATPRRAAVRHALEPVHDRRDDRHPAAALLIGLARDAFS